MTYELAKKLKDAGFPYGEYSFNTVYREEAPLAGQRIPVPTLSELIEACGERFDTLEYFRYTGGHLNKFVATYGKDYFESGKTPEEAVAKLWLSLQKNKIET